MLASIIRSLGIKKVSAQLETEINNCLASYKNDVFPCGLLSVISHLSIEKQKFFSTVRIQLSFSLPFPCCGEYKHIISHIDNTLPLLSINTEIDTVIEPVFQHELSGIKNLIVISSGKGGVGKSTTTVNLAYALQRQGCSVGILDADVYGPSLPTMLGLQGKHPRSPDGVHLEPVYKNDIAAMSTGFLADDQDAKIWRGSVASGAFEQMLKETLWGGIDYLLIDMPPGTGDIQLTLAQKVPAICSVIVTTPQDIALLDAVKGIAMFEKVNIPVLGLIENMSVHICPKCHQTTPLFGDGGGEQLASNKNISLFGKLPLNIAIRESADEGVQLSNTGENSAIIDEYTSIASKITAELYYQKDSRSPKTANKSQ